MLVLRLAPWKYDGSGSSSIDRGRRSNGHGGNYICDNVGFVCFVCGMQLCLLTKRLSRTGGAPCLSLLLVSLHAEGSSHKLTQ